MNDVAGLLRSVDLCRPAAHRYQPFYNVLVDSDDIPFQTTYVAQENIQLLVTTPGQPCLPVLHPEVRRSRNCPSGVRCRAANVWICTIWLCVALQCILRGYRSTLSALA